MLLSNDDLASYIRRKLGEGFWGQIEIDAESVTDAITDALTAYSRWKPQKVRTSYSAMIGITRIATEGTPLLLPKGVNGVLHWTKLTNIAVANANIESQMLSGTFSLYSVGAPQYDLEFYHYQRQWMEFAQRELSSSPDLEFRLNEDTQKPELWLFSPGYATNFEVHFSRQHSELKTVPDYDELIVKTLALASAKMTLGNIRSTYGSVPVANTTMTLNGPALVLAGRTEWDQAEEKLKRTAISDVASWF